MRRFLPFFRRGQTLWKTLFGIVIVIAIILLIWLAFGNWIVETTKSIIGGLSLGAAHDIVQG